MNKKNMIIISSVALVLIVGTIIALLSTGNKENNVFNKAGTFSEKEELNDVIINSSDVVLENKTIDNLTITEEVADGVVTLNNVTVTNEVKVLGGGKNSVYFNDSDINNLKVDYKNVRVVINEKTKVKTINTNKIYKLVILGEVDNVTINKNDTKSEISLEKKSKVSNLDIKSNVKLNIESTINNISITNVLDKIELNISKEGIVKDIKTTSKLKVSGEGKILKATTNKKENIESNVDIEKLEITDIVEYTVSFDTDGGSVVDNVTLLDDSTVTKPVNPTKDGYTFVKWELDGEEYNFDTKINKNITLKAVWEKVEVKDNNKPNNNNTTTTKPKPDNNNDNKKDPVVVTKYTVTFDSAGGNGFNTQTIVKGNKASNPGSPSKSGYTFKGWTLNGNAYNFNSAVNSNIRLIAKWEKVVVAPTTYLVTFDSAGGNEFNTQTIVKGNKASNPGSPSKSGYTFKGWTLNGNAYNFNSAVNSNIRLVAKWEKVITYSIEWVPVTGSAAGEYMLYIKSSNGEYVSGTVILTTQRGTQVEENITSSGKKYKKSTFSNVKIK